MVEGSLFDNISMGDDVIASETELSELFGGEPTGQDDKSGKPKPAAKPATGEPPIPPEVPLDQTPNPLDDAPLSEEELEYLVKGGKKPPAKPATTEPPKPKEEPPKPADAKPTEPPKPAASPKPADSPAADDLPEDIIEGVKATAQFMFESGRWEKYDGWEDDLENMTPEMYEEISQEQSEYKAQEMFNKSISRLGTIGQRLIQYELNGGDPEKLLDLFKQQRSLDSLDMKNEADRKYVIETYHREYADYDDDQIKDLIDSFKLSKTEEKQAENFYKKLKQIVDYRTQTEEAEQAKTKQATLERRAKFMQDFQTLVSTEFKEDSDVILKAVNEKVKLPNGTVATPFTAKFLEIQQDPAKYASLIRYVMNQEKLEKTKAVQRNNNTTESRFGQYFKNRRRAEAKDEPANPNAAAGADLRFT